MARVPNRNTRPEVLLRSLLHRTGFRFRLHVTELPGTPDVVLPKRRTVIFVNGCFWHHHARCRRAAYPATRIKFWQTKIARNVARDRHARLALRRLGWRVITVWQCELTGRRTGKTLKRLLTRLRSAVPSAEFGAVS